MIIVSQPFCTTAQFHLSFDASVLRATCLAFSEEPVVYTTDPENLDRMKVALGDPPPNLAFTAVGRGGGGHRRLRLHAILFKNLCECRRWASEAGARCLLYLAFSTPSCAIHVARNVTATEYFIIHNNFQRSRLRKTEDLLFRFFARRARSLIVLEAPVARALRAAVDVPERRIHLMPHPLPQIPSESVLPSSSRRRVLMPGRVTPAKGLETLLEAVTMLKHRDPATLERLEILVAGPNYSGVDLAGKWPVRHLDRQMTDSELQCLIRSAHFVLFPYHRRHYDYVCPGGVYWAMAAGVPVIASQLKALNELLTGDRPIGLPFGDSVHLVRRLQEAAAMGEDEYLEFRNNVAYNAAKRSTSETARCLRAILASA